MLKSQTTESGTQSVKIMEVFDMLCLEDSWRAQQGPGCSESRASQIPILSPFARSKAKLQCSQLGRQISRYLHNLGQMNIGSRLTWIFKIMFSSAFLIEIGKFSKNKCVCSSDCQCPYVPIISPQCSLRLEVTSYWQSEDRLSPLLEAGLHDFALRWLLPIQPLDHVSSQYNGEITQACLAMLLSSS